MKNLVTFFVVLTLIFLYYNNYGTFCIFVRKLYILNINYDYSLENPGPNTTEHSLSIIHSNIRSIRNKFDFITEYFLDFDILCFTETHLDVNILSDSLILTDKFDAPYRRDRSNHGGGLLVYLSHELVHKRRLDLEGYWNESIWAEIKVNL